MTAQFFSGLGPGNQTFGTGTATSAVMGQSAGVQDVLNQYYMPGRTNGLYTFGAVGYAQAGANPVSKRRDKRKVDPSPPAPYYVEEAQCAEDANKTDPIEDTVTAYALTQPRATFSSNRNP